MRSILLRLAVVSLSALALSGCAVGVFTTDLPYPVHGNPVNPTPSSAYRVECRSDPSIFNAITGGYYTGCQQLLGPYHDRAVVRTRG